MRKNIGRVYLVLLPVALAAVSFVFPVTTAAVVPSPVSVGLSAPASVTPGGNFTATVNIGAVTNFDACTYTVKFNSSLLRFDGASSGLIGTKTIPVELFKETATGEYAVIQNLPGLTGATGAGYLTQIRFTVIGTSAADARIDFYNGVLSSTLAEAITATWTGATVHIAPPGTSTVTPTSTPTLTPTPTPVTNPGSQPATGGIIDSTGRYTSSHLTRSTDQRAEINVTSGTRGRIGGIVTTTLPVVQIVGPPSSPPERSAFISAAYDFGPNGITFDPPVSLTISYDPSGLPDGALEKDCFVAWWNTNTGEWVKETSSVNPVNHTVTASVSHFTTFTVLVAVADPAPSVPAKDTPVIPVSPKPNIPVNPTAPVGEKTPDAPAGPSPAAPPPQPSVTVVEPDRDGPGFPFNLLWPWGAIAAGTILLVGILALIFSRQKNPY